MRIQRDVCALVNLWCASFLEALAGIWSFVRPDVFGKQTRLFLRRCHSTYPRSKFVVEPVVEVGELWCALLQDKSKDSVRFQLILKPGKQQEAVLELSHDLQHPRNLQLYSDNSVPPLRTVLLIFCVYLLMYVSLFGSGNNTYYRHFCKCMAQPVVMMHFNFRQHYHSSGNLMKTGSTMI